MNRQMDKRMDKTRTEMAVVIGGGILGVSTAAQLQRRGVQVTLINDGALANGASGRSLSWLNSARMRSAEYHALRIAGIDRYRSLSGRVGPVDWLRFDGGLTWDADSASNGMDAVYEHELAIAYASIRLAADGIAVVTPGVNPATIPPQGAIFNPGEGWVHLPGLIAHLAAEFVADGGRLITDQGPARVLVSGGRAVGVATAEAEYTAGAILLAAGAAVPGMAADLGIPVADGTVTGLLITASAPDVPIRAVMNTPMAALRPAPGHSLAVDADWAARKVVINSDGGYTVPPALLAELLAEASKVLVGTPALTVREFGVGPKPMPGDGEPVVGELAALPGLFLAFSHSGATLGLILGEALATEIATGRRLNYLARFRPERMRTGSHG